MAALTALLERAVSDSAVSLDVSSQRAIFALSQQSPALRAALARRPDLDPDLRDPISKDDSLDCRYAFLSRSDLTAEEISLLVVKERRTTLLKNVAQSTDDPEILALLSKKGGKGLQRLVAFNPATPEEARLAATRHAFRGMDEVPYKDRHQIYTLLADSRSVLSWALTDDEALAIRGVAIPFMPYVDSCALDPESVFEATLSLLESRSDEWARTYYRSSLSDISLSLAEVSWMLSDRQRSRLSDLLLSVVGVMQDWRSHSLRSALDRLSRPALVEELRSEALAAQELLRICSNSSSPEELEQASAKICAAGGYTMSAMLSVASLALVRNPETPLASLHGMATMAGGNVWTVAKQAAVGSPRLAALLLSLGRQLPMPVADSVQMSDICEAASREGFWPRLLVAELLRDVSSARTVLLEAPVDALPVELDTVSLQQLVDILGERTADRQWLETALSLSSGWSGRLSDLVELADHI